jgi:TonB family protein
MRSRIPLLLIAGALAPSVLAQESAPPADKPASRQPPSSTALANLSVDAFNQGKFTTAVYLLKQAVAQDPKHTWAWNDLCRAYLTLDHLDAAIDACRQQIEVFDKSTKAYNNLGVALQRQQKIDEAVAAFRKQIELSPQDRYAHANLGRLYYLLQKYSEAADELEKAVEIEPQNPANQISLGGAYLGAGQTSKGLAILDKVVQENPGASTWNGVAYQLALQGAQLEKAQQYAESALSAEATVMRNIDIDHIAVTTLRHVVSVGNYWDTLGWIHFQRGNLDKAAKFTNAAWLLNQSGAAGGHLGRIYEKRGQQQEAIQAFAMALAARGPLPDTRGRLSALLGDESKVDPLVMRARSELIETRTVRAGKLLSDKSVAEFDIMLAPEPGIADVRFRGGDQRLRQFTKVLQTVVYPSIFPDSTLAKLLRRATLTCPGDSGECLLEFAPASAALTAGLNAAPVDTEIVDRVPASSSPSVIYKVEPEYSKEALKKKLQGTVVLRIEVDTNGRARNVRVVQSLGMGLDEEAIKAVQKWQFKPGEKDGHPVTVGATLQIQFRLRKDAPQ